MRSLRTSSLLVLLAALAPLSACKKGGGAPASSTPHADGPKVGIVTDVGGRGDQSFNDSALRGLETWAAGVRFEGSGYSALSPADYAASLPKELASLHLDIHPLGVTPLVLQSKSGEDYEPNLQLLVDQGAQLTVGTGFLLENAVEAVAKRNPDARFLLIDSPILDEKGHPYTLPNVRTVVFKEEEGSFLAGALAGLVTRTGKVAFIGGMQMPLIQKFEAGFRAGLAAVNPKAAADVFVSYTGSFDNVAAGKQVGQDVLAKGADVVYHAAGSDGLGVLKAVQEAHAAGKTVYAIGVDSDQAHLAPDVVLTSMVKHVDLAVYEAVRDLRAGKLTFGDVVLGLKDGGVALSQVRLDFPGKAAALAKLEALRRQIVEGKLTVPATPTQLSAFKGAP